MIAKKQSYYIPVTMDELMARFVTTQERTGLKSKFRGQKQPLLRSSLLELENQVIETSVRNSFQTM
jgi:hypothetical protein